MKDAFIEQKFRHTFNSLAIGLALVSPEGKWLDVNPALCQIVGYTFSELILLTFQNITHPNDLNADLENLKKFINNETDLYHTEKRYIHKNGLIVWVDLIVSVVRDTENKPLFFISQVQDITERKNSESQLTEQKNHLNTLSLYLTQQNTKLEEFNQIVSHNLRTPAGNIQLLLKLFEQAESLEEKNELMESLIVSSDSLMETLNELVTMIKVKDLNNLSQERVVFQDIFNKVSHMLIAVIRKQHVQIEVDFQVSDIIYSRIYLESIIINLLSNAIKYRSAKRTPKIKFRSFIENESLILEVSDNGMGIDLVKFQGQIFKLNQTFHDHPEAIGLGLYMIKNHIKSLGGNISVASTPDVGSTFRVDFGSNRIP